MIHNVQNYKCNEVQASQLKIQGQILLKKKAVDIKPTLISENENFRAKNITRDKGGSFYNDMITPFMNER